GPACEIVKPTVVAVEDDSGNDEHNQQCPDEGFEQPGDMSVEASHLDSEDPMAYRIAEGPDEQEVLESEESGGDEGVRRIEQIRDRQTHQPVDEQGEDALPRRGQGMRTGGRQTEPF